jgi:hypothetical protein
LSHVDEKESGYNKQGIIENKPSRDVQGERPLDVDLDDGVLRVHQEDLKKKTVNYDKGRGKL